MRRGALPAAFVLAAAFPVGAAAQGTGPSEWSFAFTPYAWFSGISGTATIGPRSAEASADFGDILSSLSFTLMGTGEVRYGRFGLVADLIYLDLSEDVSTPAGSRFSGGRGSMQSLGLGFAALYRVIDESAGSLDIGGGIRPWWISTKLSLDPGSGAGAIAKTDVNWTDPVISVRGHLRLTESLGFSAYADIGGFGVGSDLTWQVAATVDWAPSDGVVVRAGWRHLAFDFASGRASLDMTISGPILGVTFRF